MCAVAPITRPRSSASDDVHAVTDKLLKFTFHNAPVRGEVVRLEEAWQAMIEHHGYPAPVMRLLGEMTAAAALLGEHDFAAFCRRREGGTTVRGLLAFEWTRDGDDVAVARVEADAFCHSMVRSLVGALLAVGDGRRPVGWPSAVLAAAVPRLLHSAS